MTVNREERSKLRKCNKKSFSSDNTESRKKRFHMAFVYNFGSLKLSVSWFIPSSSSSRIFLSLFHIHFQFSRSGVSWKSWILKLFSIKSLVQCKHHGWLHTNTFNLTLERQRRSRIKLSVNGKVFRGNGSSLTQGVGNFPKATYVLDVCLSHKTFKVMPPFKKAAKTLFYFHYLHFCQIPCFKHCCKHRYNIILMQTTWMHFILMFLFLCEQENSFSFC